MEYIFLKILNLSIAASWLILFVILFRAVFKSAPKWIVLILWSIVGLRLVFPFHIESVLSLIPSSQIITPSVLLSEKPAIDSGIEVIDNVVNPVFTESFRPDPAASVNPLQIWNHIFSVLWIIGVVLLAIYGIVTYLALKKRVSESIKDSEGIYLCDGIETPFILGIIRPRIYLPSGINKEERSHVLAHELRHLKRKDHLIKPLAYLISIIHWFNPLVWLSYHLFSKDLEEACDEAVIRDMDPNGRKAYATTLVGCSADKKTVFSYPLAFSETGVKDRVKNVLNYRKPSKKLIIGFLVVCCIAAVCFLSDPKRKKTVFVGNFSFETTGILDLEQDNDNESAQYLVWASEVYTLTDKEKELGLLLARADWQGSAKESAIEQKAFQVKLHRLWTDVVEEEDRVVFRVYYPDHKEEDPSFYFGFYSAEGNDYWAYAQFRSDLPEKYQNELKNIMLSLRYDETVFSDETINEMNENPDASYLIENFDRKNTDDIMIIYDFDYSEFESTDHFHSEDVLLADLDPADQKRIMKQIETILKDEDFEQVSPDEIKDSSIRWRLIILDANQVNITVYEKEGYICTADPDPEKWLPMVYKVNNDKLDELCDLVDEATAEME